MAEVYLLDHFKRIQNCLLINLPKTLTHASIAPYTFYPQCNAVAEVYHLDFTRIQYCLLIINLPKTLNHASIANAPRPFTTQQCGNENGVVDLMIYLQTDSPEQCTAI